MTAAEDYPHLVAFSLSATIMKKRSEGQVVFLSLRPCRLLSIRHSVIGHFADRPVTGFGETGKKIVDF